MFIGVGTVIIYKFDFLMELIEFVKIIFFF